MSVRLARTVLAEDGMDRLLFHVEVNAIERLERAEGLRDAVHLHGIVGTGRP